MAIELEGTIVPVPTMFVGDLKNKTARLTLEIMHQETNRALGSVEVVINNQAQEETETQEPTLSWDDFMAANPEGVDMQIALSNLANVMAPFSKALKNSEESSENNEEVAE